MAIEFIPCTSFPCMLERMRRPGGGCAFQQVHNLLADVPSANIVAMFDAGNTP